MTPGGASVEGVVLCTAAGHRLAVLARDVTGVEAPDADAPWAGRGFEGGTPRPEGGRLLRHQALGLVVDSVEVHTEALPLLAVPPLFATALPGVVGFVEAGGHLWPVVSLPVLAARLGAAS